MLTEQELEITLPDGVTDAVLLQPAAGGAWPGVLYLTDIGGLRPAQLEAARRLCVEGYVVLLPNIFYRNATPPVMDMADLRPTPDLFMQRVQELAKPLTPGAVERDAKGYIDFLSAQASVKDKHQLGVVGFCIAGGIALRVAAACPDQVVACASFHGGGLYEEKPSSPHLLLPRIKARLLIGHADQDRSMPAEAIAAFDKALEDWAGEFETETYQGAAHGWTTLDNPAFNAPQALRAFGKLKNLFADKLQIG